MEQLEIFYQSFILDLYRRENKINYDNSANNIEKRYFIVPLRLVENDDDPAHYTNGQRSTLMYAVDTRLLQKTERLYKVGYKKFQDNVPNWLRKKGLLGAAAKERRDELLSKWMFVKGEKPNSCYHYDMFLEDLDQMSAEDFAICIRG